MRQAEPADAVELGSHRIRRGVGITAERLWAERLRDGLIYTRAGVLDMTRRRVQRQPAVEEIVGYIEGGAS